MQKIILFYKFVTVNDPDTAMRWQRELCSRLGLKGRVIIANHGINGTLGGDLQSLKTYRKEMNLSPLFKAIDYKWSDGSSDDFPKLSVKVRDELVTLAPGEEFDVFNSGTALKPAEWKKLLKENPHITLLDARNDYESVIGKFKGAVTPKIKTFKEIKGELENLSKDKPVATYCTGDIRCEYLSAYLKHVGFQRVYHLDGGIVKYGQKFGDDGLWEGKCYVFDKRMKLAFSEQSDDIAECVHCHKQTSQQINCANAACNQQVVVCDECGDNTTYCDRHTALSAV